MGSFGKLRTKLARVLATLAGQPLTAWAEAHGYGPYVGPTGLKGTAAIDWSDAGPELGEELVAYCRERLSPIKCPRTIDFERELPRHPTGKLYKRLIRDRYWGKRDSRIV